jgi:hypothetical protein
MKRNIFCITILAGSLFTACTKDFLDRSPLDAYSNSSLWKSESDAVAALSGCYNGWEDGYHTIYMDCASDNAYNQYPWEGYTALGNGTASPGDGDIVNRWSYTTIQRCNWFLENVGVTKMDETKKKRMIAEARFLRAYQYFTLTQLYGSVPLVTKTISTEEANTVTRTPIAEVQSFILNELGAIAADLPTQYTGSDVGRIAKGAALSLKARLELYTKKYDDCIADCEQVMNLGYALFPSYANLFRIQNENNSEVILDIQYKENNYANYNLGVMPSSTSGGWGSVSPTQSLVDAYEMINGKTIKEAGSGYNENDPFANRDPRLGASIVYPGQFYQGGYYNSIEPASGDYFTGGNNSKSGYLYKKFTSNLSDYINMWNNGLNMISIRYAEVLLSYAEAKIEKGLLDNGMYDAIDAVRVRAGMPKVDRAVYSSQTSLRELIRRERRVELALEGLRWYDIKRWEIGPQTRQGMVYGTRLGKVDAETGKLTLSGNHVEVESRVFNATRDYLWPIPLKEININKGLEQNPGYN